MPARSALDLPSKKVWVCASLCIFFLHLNISPSFTLYEYHRALKIYPLISVFQQLTKSATLLKEFRHQQSTCNISKIQNYLGLTRVRRSIILELFQSSPSSSELRTKMLKVGKGGVLVLIGTWLVWSGCGASLKPASDPHPRSSSGIPCCGLTTSFVPVHPPSDAIMSGGRMGIFGMRHL